MGPRLPLKIGRRKFKKRWPTLGFSIGKASPVLFCHHQRSLKCLVHGDDFVVSGEPVDLVWMRSELASQPEINTTILGDEPGMSKEVKILNRKLCWYDGVGISHYFFLCEGNEACTRQKNSQDKHSALAPQTWNKSAKSGGGPSVPCRSTEGETSECSARPSSCPRQES